MYKFTEKTLIELLSNGLYEEVMHEWETPIMHSMAEWVCKDGGDIIEFGFGMGISATHIQKQNINSHTICENNASVLVNLYEWVKDKPNVTILEGDWYDNVNVMSKYDGIFFDTHRDKNAKHLPLVLKDIAKPNCKLTWWNNLPEPYNEFSLDGTEYEVLDVNPPKNTYFNHKKYYMPKYIIK